MIAYVTGQVHYPPTPIEENNPNSLVTGQVLVNERNEKRLYLYNLLGMPVNLPPGTYKIGIEQRPKRDKPGINYWYKSHEKAA